VGRSKAQVAVEFVMKRVPSCTVNYFVGAIQDKDPSFYRQFKVAARPGSSPLSLVVG